MSEIKPLSKTEFVNNLSDSIKNELVENYGIESVPQYHRVHKTNVDMNGLTFRLDSSTVAPTIYTDGLYEQYLDGAHIQEIAKEASERVFFAHRYSPRLPKLDLESAKKNIVLSVINTEKNQAILKDTPNYQICSGDLSVVPRWVINDEASFLVNNKLASQLGITPEEVLAIGKNNLDKESFEIQPLMSMLRGFMGEELAGIPDIEGPEILVMTDANRVRGARVLLSNRALNTAHDILGSDYAVIPSSIHEVLAFPVSDEMKPEEIRAIISEVNGSVVQPDEVLSTNVFFYNGDKLSLVGDSFRVDGLSVEEPKMEHEGIRMAM